MPTASSTDPPFRLVRAADAETLAGEIGAIALLLDSSDTGGALSTQRVTLRGGGAALRLLRAVPVNYFAAEDATVAGELWEYLAGWYERNTGLNNSTLLEPLEADDFAFVNHARWNKGLPRVMLDQRRVVVDHQTVVW